MANQYWQPTHYVDLISYARILTCNYVPFRILALSLMRCIYKMFCFVVNEWSHTSLVQRNFTTMVISHCCENPVKRTWQIIEEALRELVLTFKHMKNARCNWQEQWRLVGPNLGRAQIQLFINRMHGKQNKAFFCVSVT